MSIFHKTDELVNDFKTGCLVQKYKSSKVPFSYFSKMWSLSEYDVFFANKPKFDKIVRSEGGDLEYYSYQPCDEEGNPIKKK